MAEQPGPEALMREDPGQNNPLLNGLILNVLLPERMMWDKPDTFPVRHTKGECRRLQHSPFNSG